jgi:hypothetical protein
VPGEIVVAPNGTHIEDVDIELVYRGARVVSPRGEVTPAGEPYVFAYRSFFVPADWTVKFYAHDGSGPMDGPPWKTAHRDRMDFMSGRGIADGVPADHVAVVADADLTLPDGSYTIRTISDDAIRVTVDGERVIDHWTAHESALDDASLAGGTHHVTVEYYENEGFAELRFEILKRTR